MAGVTTTNAARAWLKKHGQVNERSLAETFAQDFDSRWRFNADEGYWLQWVGTHWARNQTLEFLDALGHYAAQFAQLFRKLGDITHSEALKLKSQRTVTALERICRGMPSFMARSALFDADAFLLGTPGGTVDLRTGQLKPADPADHITMLTAVTPADKADETTCPKWLAFLAQVMNSNKDLIRTMQQWAGVGATGSARDQRIMFIYGSGRNGKGVYCRTIAGLLGGHVSSAPRGLFMQQSGSFQQHPTALVNVVVSRMCLASEIPEGATWDVELIKGLTGGDTMEIRRMRENFYEVVPRCTITIMGNLKPELKTVDEAVRGRFLVVTFPVFIEEKDRIVDFEKLLIAEEGPAILRWIIDGAVDRENSKKLFVAQAITDDTDDYMAEENIMADFIGEFFDRAPAGTPADNEEWRVKTGDAYRDWRDFCTRFGRKSGARNPFTTAMKAAGIGYYRSGSDRYFTGIRKGLPKDIAGVAV